ncbi:ankyrin repeat and SAM domain-containing protein 1A-like isoform X2 [Sitodiplosis mosellana]|uniref:ankyrin repeat and SAM domain-containing protein 1A-like isoform X2 n=1 Tax=Sitodiplosis mosellana TaxID=263140 RepID=UPI0024438D51|nr:ankyrin repeat and SAM domain-containing protein 1A-like isoform X2 [Sitodiplosis mosellana]
MGKEAELLDAARNGNITLIEKILSQRGKRSGPLASLRRGPGANIQDSAGYSALHYSSLNGHIECVRLLLMHEASANLPDSRGSSPLHLAAWAGHQDIVKLLLTQSNRPANPNLQTIDNETPLHCASQHGHTGALCTLLAHGANPNMVNSRGEKPLDLAAQYGRLQVVQMLVRAHPELIHPYKKHYNDKKRSIHTHTPLHLASRNGHKHVVEVLLAAGVDVNILTTTGTALHEAALCGKDSVVKILLEYGTDLGVTDSEGRTALDLLKQFPPHVTRGIVSVINNYQNSLALSNSEQEDILKVSRNIPSRESYYDDQSYHSRGTRDSHAWSSYSNDASSMLESPSSSVGSLDPASPRMRAGGDNNGGFYVTMTPLNSNSKVSPTPPKKPPRRNLSISPSTSKSIVSARSNMSGSSSQTSPYEYLYLAQSGDKKSTMNKAASVDQCQNYVKMMSPAAKEKHEAVLKQMSEHLMKSAGNMDEDGDSMLAAPLRSYNPNRKLRRIRDNYDYSQNGSRHSYGNNSSHNDNDNTPMSPSNYRQPPTPDHPPPNAKTAERVILDRIRPLSQEYRRSMAMLEYIRHSQNGTATFGGYENRHRMNSEKREKRQSAPQPMKQMSNRHHHHRQSYQENVVPPPQMYSSSSRSRHRIANNRDSSLSPCSSDVIMSLNASSGSLSSSSDRSASTDCVEYVTDVPFADDVSKESLFITHKKVVVDALCAS